MQTKFLLSATLSGMLFTSGIRLEPPEPKVTIEPLSIVSQYTDTIIILPEIKIKAPKIETPFECLRKNIWFEARSEGVEGMTAVANVTLTRTKTPNYPRDVCGVVYQTMRDHDGSIRKNKCQFSWYCDGKPDVIKLTKRNKEVWELSGQIAHKALAGELPMIVNDATHYHEYSINPKWAGDMMQVTQINNHIFYKNY